MAGKVPYTPSFPVGSPQFSFTPSIRRNPILDSRQNGTASFSATNAKAQEASSKKAGSAYQSKPLPIIAKHELVGRASKSSSKEKSTIRKSPILEPRQNGAGSFSAANANAQEDSSKKAGSAFQSKPPLTIGKPDLKLAGSTSNASSKAASAVSTPLTRSPSLAPKKEEEERFTSHCLFELDESAMQCELEVTLDVFEEEEKANLAAASILRQKLPTRPALCLKSMHIAPLDPSRRKSYP